MAAFILAAILTAVFWRAISAGQPVADADVRAETPRSNAAEAALLMAAALIIPTLFTIALADVFVLPKITALRVTLVAALILTAWGASQRRGATAFAASGASQAIDLALLVFGGLTVLATVFSIDPAHSLLGENEQYQGLLTTLMYVAFFYLARSSIADHRRLSLLAVAVTAGASLVAGYAVVQQLHLDPIWSTWKGRVFSTFGQSEWLAAYLVLVLPMGVALLGQVRSNTRLLVASSLVLIFIALLLAKSRGGYLGILVAVAVFGAAVAQRVRPTRRWLLAGPALAVVLVLTLALPPVRRETEAIVRRAASTSDLTEGSIAHRLDLWRVGAAIAIEHPILGTGPETFPLLFPQYRDTILASRRDFWIRFRPESPHNVYLAIAGGAGFPALAAYFTLLVAVFIQLCRGLRKTPSLAARMLLAGVLAAAAGHLVTDLFMTGDVAGSWLFWLLLGAGVGYAESLDLLPRWSLAPT